MTTRSPEQQAKGKRVEAIKITLPDSDYTGNVEYQAFVQGIGWQTWKKNGELAGTSGQSKRIEALRVKTDRRNR